MDHAANDPTSARADEIRTRLEVIAEELADLSMVTLREAIDGGASNRPAAERTYTKARRAVEKAIALLEGPRPDPFD